MTESNDGAKESNREKKTEWIELQKESCMEKEQANLNAKAYVFEAREREKRSDWMMKQQREYAWKYQQSQKKQ